MEEVIFLGTQEIEVGGGEGAGQRWWRGCGSEVMKVGVRGDDEGVGQRR